MGEADFFAYDGYMVPHDFDPKPYIRDLKIRMITEDMNFGIKQRCVDKYSENIDAILANFNDFIITGSLALNLYGLLDRSMSDLDVILFDQNCDIPMLASNYLEQGEFSTDRLGYAYLSSVESFSLFNFISSSNKIKYLKNIFSNKQTKFDLFLDKEKERKFKTFSYKGKEIKVHDPIEIIEQKMSMVENNKNSYYVMNSVSKNTLDLWRIFNTIDSIS